MKTIKLSLFILAVLGTSAWSIQTPIYTVFSDVDGPTDNVFVFGVAGANSVSLDSTTATPTPPEGFRSMQATANPVTNNGSAAGWSTFGFFYLNKGTSNPRPVDFSQYAATGELRFWANCNSNAFEMVVQHLDGSQDGFDFSGWFPTNQWVPMYIPLTDFTNPPNGDGPEINWTDIDSPFLINFFQPGMCYFDDIRFVNPPAPGAEMFNVALKNISDQSPATQLSWNSPVALNGWSVSNQYIELQVDAESEGWGVQMYTDNTGTLIPANPTYIVSGSSNPAGMVEVADPHYTVPLAWSVKAGTQTPTAAAPVAAEPNNNGGKCAAANTDPNSFQWLYMQDVQTPAVSSLCQNGFQNGDPFSVVQNNQGIHFGQSPTQFGAAVPPNYVFLQANFGVAFAQQQYQTHSIIVEFFNY